MEVRSPFAIRRKLRLPSHPRSQAILFAHHQAIVDKLVSSTLTGRHLLIVRQKIAEATDFEDRGELLAVTPTASE